MKALSKKIQKKRKLRTPGRVILRKCSSPLMPVVLSVYGGLGLGLALNPTRNPYYRKARDWLMGDWCTGLSFRFSAVAKKNPTALNF